MIVFGAMKVVDDLNAFPPSGGIHPHYSPMAIIEGCQLDCEKHCTIPFGSCVQAPGGETKNTPRERTKDGILLRVVHNQQSGCEVMNLKTGKPIKRHHVKLIPTPTEVIKQVEALAARGGFKRTNEPMLHTYHALTTGVVDDDPPIIITHEL